MSECANRVPNTDLTCGDEIGDLRRYCSTECSDREGQAELDALGITPGMMKTALDGYYECDEMIKKRSDDSSSS